MPLCALDALRESGRRPIGETLLLLLRDRVAMGYYSRPEIADAIARAILRAPSIGFCPRRAT